MVIVQPYGTMRYAATSYTGPTLMPTHSRTTLYATWLQCKHTYLDTVNSTTCMSLGVSNVLEMVDTFNTY